MTASEHPHRRFNPLTGQWILVSPHRTQRPWQGKREEAGHEGRPRHDPDCYLCAGNTRAGGHVNPEYADVFVFTNDFPALLPAAEQTLPDTASPARSRDARLFRSQAVDGTCRVVCFSPRHDLTLPEMAVESIGKVVDVWAAQSRELGEQYRWVQVFENKGAIMGCSNPHPHGQIWASNQIPETPAAEDRRQAEYHSETGRVMLVDYVQQELDAGERIVVANDGWVALVPYWATWPFEVLLLPRRHVLRMDTLDAAERAQLADILKRLLIRYDNLFETSFPYSMGWHGAPFPVRGHDDDRPHWQLHAHFFPPLLRSANVKKFMVGYEMLGEPQRDLTAEQAAARLRGLSETHYRAGSAQA